MSAPGLGTYFVGAYALTWIFWVPAAVMVRGQPEPAGPALILIVLGGLGPMLAAILLSVRESGSAGVSALFRQLLRWRIGWVWYAVAMPGMAALMLSVVPLHLALGGSLRTETLRGKMAALPLLFLSVALFGGGLDEEMGWRGYALPRLQERFHPLVANLVLGLLWSSWHLPLWFVSASPQASMSFPVFVVSTTALSILLGWIYNGTGGSLLIAILAHTSINVAASLVQETLLATAARMQLLQRGGSAVMLAAALAVVLVTHEPFARLAARRHD